MRNTLVKSLVAAAVGSLLMVGSAFATLYYSPTLTDIADWTVQGGDPVTAVNIQQSGDLVDFVSTFQADGPRTVFFGADGLTISGYDVFSLSIYNHNENPWDYSLWVTSSSGTTRSSIVGITNGLTTFQTLSLDIHDLGTITGLGFSVGANVPLPSLVGGNHDYTNQTYVQPVPEPATMLLFGAGLAGLAGIARRRKIEK